MPRNLEEEFTSAAREALSLEPDATKKEIAAKTKDMDDTAITALAAKVAGKVSATREEMMAHLLKQF